MTATEVETTEMVHQPNGAGPPAPPAAEYVTGFQGMATEPFPESVRKVLAESVEPSEVEIKPDGIVYLPGHWYRKQLSRAFGAGGWGIAPRTPARVMGNVVVWDGVLMALGRVVATGLGECAYRANNGNMSYASCWEGAKTDAIGRACKDLGMAWELWDPKWRKDFLAKYAEQYDGEKWDGRAQRKVPAKLWRLKSGKKASAEDQARGAGGVAPEPHIAPGDDGTAASEAETKAVRDRMKELKHTRASAERWLTSLFGVATVAALSKDQAASALALLLAQGQDDNDEAYGKVFERLKAEGKVRA